MSTVARVRSLRGLLAISNTVSIRHVQSVPQEVAKDLSAPVVHPATQRFQGEIRLAGTMYFADAMRCRSNRRLGFACLLMMVAGCAMFQQEEVIYLTEAKRLHATQAQVKRRLGVPKFAHSLSSGETIWKSNLDEHRWRPQRSRDKLLRSVRRVSIRRRSCVTGLVTVAETCGGGSHRRKIPR